MSKSRATKAHPNRIFDLTKARNWTYADVAERVRKIAARRGDNNRAKVHEVTINRLATGAARLTQEWMELLAEVYGVQATEIISAPNAGNLRRVRVVCALEAGNWRKTPDLPEEEQHDVMIPDELALAAATFYSGIIKGPGSNLRYSPNSIAILSKIEQKPGEIEVGKRYHVRASRPDGLIEDSLKLLVQDSAGKYWLRPESDHPEHQEWLPLAGRDDLKVEIIGRVRGVFYRED